MAGKVPIEQPLCGRPAAANPRTLQYEAPPLSIPLSNQMTDHASSAS